jgi:hypothetical protein
MGDVDDSTALPQSCKELDRRVVGGKGQSNDDQRAASKPRTRRTRTWPIAGWGGGGCPSAITPRGAHAAA